MKKVMFFRPMFYMGGTEIAILNLISRLKNDKIELYIGYSDEASDMKLLSRFKRYAKVVKIDDKIKMDIVVNCSPYSHSFEKMEKIKRKKTYLWFHHFGESDEIVLQSKKSLKKIDKLIVVSDYCHNLALEYPDSKYIKNKITKIYNLVDEATIKRKAKEKTNLEFAKDLNIVTVSRLCHKKGFLRVKEFVRALKEKQIDFKWFIVGGNFDQVIENEIKDSFKDYQDEVIFTGFINNPFPIIKNCDYMALLSDKETWGLVISEAKILEVPCLVTDFEVVHEQIEHNKNGIIFKKDDIENYKNSIDDILSSKTKLKENLKKFKYPNDQIIENWNKILK